MARESDEEFQERKSCCCAEMRIISEGAGKVNVSTK